MMWVRHIASVLILTGGIVAARAANESVATGLESCFQAARTADAICSKEIEDPAQRVDCLQKARSAHLECLEHVLSETPTGPAAPKAPSEASRSKPPATVAPPKGSLPGQSSQTDSSQTPTGVPSAKDSNGQAIGKPNPPDLSNSPPMPTGAIPPAISSKSIDVGRTNGTNWVVSETTSPIDYSPLVTAQIRSASPAKDAPTLLLVGCRKLRTELIVRTNGTWATTRRNELRIEYQINDQPAVGLPWTLSSDGKTAAYKDDPVGFLQSLPDGARLKINVADRTSSHESTFQLDGWDAIRKKISTACKWTRAADKTSSDKP
jgi:hypothetical protein